jgi:hypothetical protein
MAPSCRARVVRAARARLMFFSSSRFAWETWAKRRNRGCTAGGRTLS